MKAKERIKQTFEEIKDLVNRKTGLERIEHTSLKCNNCKQFSIIRLKHIDYFSNCCINSNCKYGRDFESINKLIFEIIRRSRNC